MKTFEKIAEEVADEMKEKIHPVIMDRYTIFGTKEIVIEAAKRYACQSLKELVSEVERRRDIILSEPDGLVREQMIKNLAINL